LVRQLNFYNFRKINRERTFWIYKHQLFHRDRPEDLHLLRRRTCPGIDGRKHRFTVYSRKVSDSPDEDDRKSSDDDSCFVDTNAETTRRNKKRNFAGAERDGESKRFARGRVARPSRDEKAVSDEDAAVDLSLLKAPRRSSLSSRPSASDLHAIKDEDEDSTSEVDDRTARREQAHIVSQVAIKLEEYARKAKKNFSRSRNGGGIVTPPLGGGQLPSGHYYRSLLTYDDEYPTTFPVRKCSSVSVLTDIDGQVSDDEYATPPVTPSPRKRSSVISIKPPVDDMVLVRTISDNIMKSGIDKSKTVASAAIACFCMANVPDEQDGDACAKIFSLLSTCDMLNHEFMQYRYALHPMGCSNSVSVSTFCPSAIRRDFDKATFSVQEIWERAASRHDAMRDFKTFAVNYMKSLLETVKFSEEQRRAMHQTANVWSQSVNP
jgi:hypothetical protein